MVDEIPQKLEDLTDYELLEIIIRWEACKEQWNDKSEGILYKRLSEIHRKLKEGKELTGVSVDSKEEIKRQIVARIKGTIAETDALTDMLFRDPMKAIVDMAERKGYVRGLTEMARMLKIEIP